jgi:hypothetical protein
MNQLQSPPSIASSADSPASSSRPKLLFFQRRYDKTTPVFLQTHFQDHVRCLALFFDVTVVNRDCDFLEVCDLYRPDLALFETGSNLETSHALRIKNIHANAGVARLGLFNFDGWCETRAGVLSEMDHWGIEDFVSIAVTAAEHTPVIAQRLICWPNFINAEVHRDYGEGKSIPVLLTGAQAPLYPWRARVFKRVSARFPATLIKHPGYYQSRGETMVQGEAYARMISASIFVPTCGTVANEVVRKHFEIPACGACLITERSPGLLAAGFVDMDNCVFADDGDVLDKLEHLLANPEELQRITAAGHALVHSRHTMAHRDQILQWWKLHRQLKQGETITQLNPFESPVIAVATEAGVSKALIDSGGLHLALLAEGQALLETPHVDAARSKFSAVLGYMTNLPEAKFCLALCELHRGQARAAHALLRDTVEYTLVGYRAVDPDPVEWAYYVISLMCLGRGSEAARHARKFMHLQHPELERARWAAHAAADRSVPDRPHGLQIHHRRSLHRLPERSIQSWLQELDAMLRACGQADAAERVVEASSAITPPSPQVALPPGPIGRLAYQFTLSALWRRLDDPVLAFRLQRKLKNARHRLLRLQQAFST